MAGTPQRFASFTPLGVERPDANRAAPSSRVPPSPFDLSPRGARSASFSREISRRRATGQGMARGRGRVGEKGEGPLPLRREDRQLSNEHLGEPRALFAELRKRAQKRLSAGEPRTLSPPLLPAAGPCRSRSRRTRALPSSSRPHERAPRAEDERRGAAPDRPPPPRPRGHKASTRDRSTRTTRARHAHATRECRERDRRPPSERARGGELHHPARKAAVGESVVELRPLEERAFPASPHCCQLSPSPAIRQIRCANRVSAKPRSGRGKRAHTEQIISQRPRPQMGAGKDGFSPPAREKLILIS